jgi:DNA-binding Lrp family transcriptional regulator
MPPSTLLLKTPSQIRTVTHPLRLEIIERLQVDGPDSIAGLASKLDRPANALTYHVRLLEKAGAVLAKSYRRSGRRLEAVYAVAATRIALGADARSPASMRAAAASGTAICRMASREIGAALAEGLAKDSVSPMGRRVKTWLTPEQVAKVHQKLESIERYLASCQRRKQGRPHVMTTFLVPLREERKS